MGILAPASLKFFAFHGCVSPSSSGLSLLHATCIRADLETLTIILTCSPTPLDTWIALSIKAVSKVFHHKLPMELLQSPAQDTLKKKQMLHVLEKAMEHFQPESILHIAAKTGSIHQIAKLLDLGKKMNAFSKKAEDKAATPLMLASAYNSSLAVEYLLDRGANVFISDAQLNVAIHHAAMSGNERSIQALIMHGSDVNAKGFRGKTPLHLASLRGHTAAVRALCENGADVKARTAFGDTPLICAAQGDHIECIDALLQHDASIHDRNSIGYSALYYAAKKGYTALVKLLLHLGSDVNARSRMRDTPLIIASSVVGNKEIVQLLLRSSGDVTLTDRQGRGPLHHAADPDIVDVLLGARAYLEASDLYGGLTPLLFACRLENPQSNLSVITRLIEHGANVNRQEVISQYTALHHLCARNDQGAAVPVVQALLDKGAAVDATDSEGETPLFAAIRCADVPIVRLLLSNGASVNVANDCSFTPLQVVVEAQDTHGEASQIITKELEKYKDVNS